jgi:site-specific DNA-methyltransferase (adenine-specific)
MKDIGYGFAGIADLDEKAPQKVKYSAWGSWLSASAPYMHNPKECVLIGYKDQWKKLNVGESYWTDSDEDKKGFMEVVSGLWGYFAETRGMTEANFSLDIPVKAIKFMTYKDDVVLDPFMGSGTTAVASVNLDRNYIGFEVSENYCKIARSRVLKEKIKIETAEKGFDFWE